MVELVRGATTQAARSDQQRGCAVLIGGELPTDAMRLYRLFFKEKKGYKQVSLRETTTASQKKVESIKQLRRWEPAKFKQFKEVEVYGTSKKPH